MTRNQRLDAACRALEAKEPYFAPSFAAARALLRTATFGADMIRFPRGIVCRDGRCGCLGATECLHEVGYRMYAGELR